MKVLQICSYYAINDLYKNLFSNLNLKSIKSDVYIPCKKKNIPNDKKYNEFYSDVYKNGDNLYEKIANIISQYQFYNKNNEIYKDMKDKLKIDSYSILHAHSLFENGYLAYRAKKEFGIDYVVAVRNTDVNGYFKIARHLRKIGVEIMKNAKKVIFISPSYKDFVLHNYIKEKDFEYINNKCLVEPNGIDDYWINNISEEVKNLKDRNEIRLIQVGRVDRNKNIETSIEICKELRNRGIKSFIKIVGDGDEKKNLIDKYKSLEYVKFYDKASKENLKEYYDDSDIFIMPSKYETFGLVYPEAMSRGLPIVYTKGQGFDKYFEDGEVGYPIIYDSVNEGVGAVIDIIENYNFISNNAKNNSQRFSWDIISNDYKNIYLE
ncbi:glycosyltransferase family 4 protein [Clostridium tertium]|uniref:glycosyltransferase family 4 protein n=1 Tax=Clostridium tertium TaxID=1559 RepID=UPI000DD0BFEE|nr:glycosyltransferase family 4 protein [Clostridium tertium]